MWLIADSGQTAEVPWCIYMFNFLGTYYIKSSSKIKVKIYVVLLFFLKQPSIWEETKTQHHQDKI